MKIKLLVLGLAQLLLFSVAVVNADNCCNLGWQCQNRQEWIEGYYAYRVSQCAPPTSLHPAQSSTIAASEIDNCCGIDRLCQQEHEWIAGYWAFQNGQCHAPAAARLTETPAAAPTAANDNCCGIDRWCQQEQEWIEGYWAFQKGQCLGPAADSQTGTLPPASPAVIDNCCGIDRQCHSELEWTAGYHAYRHGSCGIPQVPTLAGGIKIEGPADYVADTLAALDLLLNRAPKWYYYVTDIVSVIRMANIVGAVAHLDSESVSTQYWSSPSRAGLKPGQYPVRYSGEKQTTFIAMMLVHEACHLHAFKNKVEDRCHADHVPYGMLEAITDIDTKRLLH